MRVSGWLLVVTLAYPTTLWADDASDDAECHNKQIPMSQANDACDRVIASYDVQQKILALLDQTATVLRSNPDEAIQSLTYIISLENIYPYLAARAYRQRADAYAAKGDKANAEADHAAAKRLGGD